MGRALTAVQRRQLRHEEYWVVGTAVTGVVVDNLGLLLSSLCFVAGTPVVTTASGGELWYAAYAGVVALGASAYVVCERRRRKNLARDHFFGEESFDDIPPSLATLDDPHEDDAARLTLLCDRLFNGDEPDSWSDSSAITSKATPSTGGPRVALDSRGLTGREHGTALIAERPNSSSAPTIPLIERGVHAGLSAGERRWAIHRQNIAPMSLAPCSTRSSRMPKSVG